MSVLRRAGGRWRLLVHSRDGGLSHGASPRRESDRAFYRHHPLPDTEFDELVVGRWLHVEQMDTGVWWINLGGVTVHVTADRNGRPRRVWVCGPDDYDRPVPGCVYDLTWGSRVEES